MNLLLLEALDEQTRTDLRNRAVKRVGRLLRDRTKEDGGTRVIGEFTDKTFPTFDQVADLVDDASQEVFITAGQHFTTATEPAAWVLIAMRAAMLVEIGYPIDQRHSQFDRLKDLYETGLTRLSDATMEEGAGGEAGSGDDALLPLFSFPPGDLLPHVPGSEQPLGPLATW